MPASTKARLLEISIEEFEKLFSVLKKIDSVTAEKTDDQGDSIKIIVAHRAHWVELFLNWHASGLAGNVVYMPAEGYKWSQLKKYNQLLRDHHQASDWKALLDWLQESHTRMLALIDGLTDEELFGAPMRGANSPWTVGRFAEANGASHYRSALKFVKMKLKTQTRP